MIGIIVYEVNKEPGTLWERGVKMAEDDYYTPPQAAHILSLSRRRVTQMLKAGYLQGEQLDNGRWKIPAAAVTAPLQRRTGRGSPPRPSRRSQRATPKEETKERAARQERRLERLTD